MVFLKAVTRHSATGIAIFGMGLLLVYAGATLADGLLRAFANQPIDLVREIGDLVCAVAAASCLPITLERRSNIRLQVFSGRMPRISRFLNTFADIVILLTLTGMAWQMLAYAGKTLKAGDITWLMGIPKAPFWYVVDAIFWVAVIVQAKMLGREHTVEGPAA